MKILLALLFSVLSIGSEPFSIQFSIFEGKIVTAIPPKDKDFAFIIPGKLDTYIYATESDYYHDYQRSYFAITNAKGGWDAMRHYEILANGCIPYFLDLDKCDPRVMPFLPKTLIKAAMNLDGVSYGKIDHKKFNKKRYFELLKQLVEHTRTYLTTRNMALYILSKIRYTGKGNILFLTQKVEPDYMAVCTLIGLKELFNERVIDIPKLDFIYTSYFENIKELYGKGISYTRIIEDISINRENIQQRIENKEFDLIVYGAIHRGLPFHDLVKQVYEPDEIVYICGEDCHTCPYRNFTNLFLREFDTCSPLAWPYYMKVHRK